VIGIIINNRSLDHSFCGCLSFYPSVCWSVYLFVCLFLSLALPFGVYNFTFVCCFLERPREKRRTIILYCKEIHFTAHHNLLRFIVEVLEFSRCSNAGGDEDNAPRPVEIIGTRIWRDSKVTKNIFRLNLLKISIGMKCMVYGYDNIEVHFGRNRSAVLSYFTRHLDTSRMSSRSEGALERVIDSSGQIFGFDSLVERVLPM